MNKPIKVQATDITDVVRAAAIELAWLCKHKFGDQDIVIEGNDLVHQDTKTILGDYEITVRCTVGAAMLDPDEDDE